MGKLIVKNIGMLATPEGKTARRGAKQGEIRVLKDAYVVIEDGMVVAIATVNERLERGGVAELTVETSPRYRGRGYALSTVTALCGYLLERGAIVAYCCRNTHTKSNKVARHVGFARVGRFYAVSAYRIHE